MSYISDNHRCGMCNGVYNIIVKREERDNESQCPNCLREGKAGKGKRTISMPNVNTVTYPDGRKRPEIQRYKEQVAVQKAAKADREKKL